MAKLLQPLMRRLTIPPTLALSSPLWGASAFSPLSLFANGETGFWYDFSRTDRLRQVSDGSGLPPANDELVGWAKSLDPTERIATQATSAARPVWKTGGFLRFDGSDDNLLTTLPTSGAMTLATKVKFGASGANRTVLGAATSGTTRASIIRLPDGRIGAGVGAISQATIVGGSDVSGQTGVAAVSWNGTTVNLYLNGSITYTNSHPAPTGAEVFRLGATNGAGAAGNYGNDDHFHDFAINRALTPAEVLNLTNSWGTS